MIKRIIFSTLSFIFLSCLTYAAPGDLVQFPTNLDLSYPLSIEGQSQLIRDFQTLPANGMNWTEEEKALYHELRRNTAQTNQVLQDKRISLPDWQFASHGAYAFDIDNDEQSYTIVIVNQRSPLATPNRGDYGFCTMKVYTDPTSFYKVLIYYFNYNIYTGEIYGEESRGQTRNGQWAIIKIGQPVTPSTMKPWIYNAALMNLIYISWY